MPGTCFAAWLKWVVERLPNHTINSILKLMPSRSLSSLIRVQMIEDLISDYKDTAILHGNGTMSGNKRKANQAYTRLQNILKKITEIDEDKALLDLFSDENVWVRLWAAAHSLEIDETKAKKNLRHLADAEIPIVSMNARYTLQEWDNGSLKFRA